MPQNNGRPDEADPSSVFMQPQAEEPTELQTPPNPVSAAEPPRPSLVKRMSADPSACASAPAIQAERPMPLPKSSGMTAKTGPSLAFRIRKVVFGSNKGSLDARQKKMAGLVGVLGVVFGVVMFISLGGVGQTKAAPGTDAPQEPVIQSHGKKAAQDWTNPQPLPADLRDATATASRKTTSAGDVYDTSGSGDLVVKGIVFSQKKPSAIINNEIRTEGQTINGVTIVRITKNAVEFKSNDKQWTQQVQR